MRSLIGTVPNCDPTIISDINHILMSSDSRRQRGVIAMLGTLIGTRLDPDLLAGSRIFPTRSTTTLISCIHV
jgi:hypothetical protein